MPPRSAAAPAMLASLHARLEAHLAERASRTRDSPGARLTWCRIPLTGTNKTIVYRAYQASAGRADQASAGCDLVFGGAGPGGRDVGVRLHEYV